MLQSKYLNELVQIGGRALEYEDRYIAGCVAVNKHLYDDKGPAGILRIANERYYQFVIARALMSGYHYSVAIEKQTFDFDLRERAGGALMARGEMKTWFSERGAVELPGMRCDIAKLRNCGYPAFFLVATFWPPGEAEEEKGRLKRELDFSDEAEVSEYAFRTVGWMPAPEREFCLLGFTVQ